MGWAGDVTGIRLGTGEFGNTAVFKDCGSGAQKTQTVEEGFEIIGAESFEATGMMVTLEGGSMERKEVSQL